MNRHSSMEVGIPHTDMSVYPVSKTASRCYTTDIFRTFSRCYSHVDGIMLFATTIDYMDCQTLGPISSIMRADFHLGDKDMTSWRRHLDTPMRSSSWVAPRSRWKSAQALFTLLRFTMELVMGFAWQKRTLKQKKAAFALSNSEGS